MQHEKPIVIELQRLATDKNNDITDLLRKALLVATKLGLKDFREWINHELHGYHGYADTDIPDYRKCHAEIMLRNPYHGLVPVIFHNSEIADIFCNIKVRDPIGSLIDLLAASEGGPGHIGFTLLPEQASFLLKQQGRFGLPAERTVSRNQIASIIDAVRTTILEWSLKLESEGIVGVGLTFSDDEKRKAASSTEIRIQNFQGILGNVEHSVVTQNLQMTTRKGDIASLRQYLESLGLQEADLDELEQAIKSEPPPTQSSGFGKRVSEWIGKMVSKAARGVWEISVGAAGNLLAIAISSYYGL